jgi:hypothetical protein
MARIDEALGDVLGDPPIVGRDHPHRLPLGWKYDRRGGSVPPRPVHCLSPVRQGAPGRHPDLAAR